MNETEDLVTISDDEVASEHSRKRKFSFSSADTIILDDILAGDVNEKIIEILDSTSSIQQQTQEIISSASESCSVLANFIHTCLNLENSEGMKRVIQHTLLRVYNEADEDYKSSKSLARAVENSHKCVINDPKHKFTYLKNLTDTLKFHKAKKRIPLITIAKNLKENNKCNLDGSLDISPIPVKKQKMTDIVIESESDEESDVIKIDDRQPENVTDQDNQIRPPNNGISQIEYDTISLDSDESMSESNDDEEKSTTENEIVSKNKEEENSLLMPRIASVYQLKRSPSPDLDSERSIQKSDKSVDGPDAEKENKAQEEQSLNIDKVDLDKKVQDIENKIMQLEDLVKKYEELEVTNDTKWSPYILCEKAKAEIVELYQELCSLTGHSAVKQRKLRLQVLEGHPPEPTKKLEEFINSNIGKNGEAPFPDYGDVVACVLQASTEYKLGWNKSQVMKEASALFRQCGQALQKRRQQREYRDLCTLVKAEPSTFDGDPADSDPELLRKLQENRKIAAKKENELLERFTQLQYLPTKPTAPSVDTNRKGELPSVSLDGAIPVNSKTTCPETIESIPIPDDSSGSSSGGKQNGGKTSDDVVDGVCGTFLKNNVTVALTDSERSDSETDSHPDLDDNNVMNNAVSQSTEVKVTLGNESGSTSEVTPLNSDVKLKKEPVDIAKMLDDLGDDYTISIIEFEDPFLAIEISSDVDYEAPVKMQTNE